MHSTFPAAVAASTPLSDSTVMRALRSLAAQIRHTNNVRATRVALHKLTDRELDDIGLCRAQIDDLAVGYGRR